MRIIDADALLERVDKEREYLIARGQTGAEHILVHNFRDLVENAPTVPQVTVCAENADEKTIEELKAELERVINEGRPQGEWYYNYQQGWHCSICHESVEDMPTVMGKANFDYCPNCGAKMQKGGTE